MKLSLEPPKILSCKLRLLVSANQDSDEDEDEDILKLAQAESLPVTHAADVSLRLPARSAPICLVALNRSELSVMVNYQANCKSLYNTRLPYQLHTYCKFLNDLSELSSIFIGSIIKYLALLYNISLFSIKLYFLFCSVKATLIRNAELQ